MVSLKVKTDKKIKEIMDKYAGRLENVFDLLTEFGIYMLDSISLNFERGGRPRKWKKSKRATSTGGRTLVDNAILSGSMEFDVVGNNKLDIGDTGGKLEYTAVHNYGIRKTVSVSQHGREITEAFGKKLKESKIIIVKSFSRKMKMPKRQFLLLQNKDFKVFDKMAGAYVTK